MTTKKLFRELQELPVVASVAYTDHPKTGEHVVRVSADDTLCPDIMDAASRHNRVVKSPRTANHIYLSTAAEEQEVESLWWHR